MATRRHFLKQSVIAMAGIGNAPLWLARAAATAPGDRKKILVVIFQRGAADGLNVVVPHGERHYYSLRPTIAIPCDQVLDLDGYFGLHPALAPLKPMYDARQLAIVEAVGSPDPTRSHFDAQDYMESGTPGIKSTRDGWLNRALPRHGTASSVRAVALGPVVPRALRGVNPALAVSNLSEFHVRGDQPGTTFEQLYGSTADERLRTAGRETFAAVKLLEALERQGYAPANGALYPNGRLGQSLRQIAQLIKGDLGLEVAFADIGGWDTHVNEVAASPTAGQLANLLGNFAGALAAFQRDLGDRMEDVAVLTMSEFGRTARENGNRGTDHGHANVMLAFGGAVRGGKVYGEWPGMAPEQLYEGRDLALTTDFRTVLAEFVAGQLGSSDTGRVFPGFAASRRLGILKEL